MAKVFGESGRYVSDVDQKQSIRIILLVVVLVGGLGVVEGFVLSSLLPSVPMPALVRAGITVGVVPAILLLWKWGSRKMNEIERKRRQFRRGADGENTVARALTRFPDDFFVINDLTTPFGNVDHIVIGPTGVFILDAKAWRGVVTADGKGELLENGRPTPKAEIRKFVGRTLSIRDKVRTLAPGMDPFYHMVFVFTSARVDAKWGSTGKVNCLRDEQLYDYIVENGFGKPLSAADAQTLAQAFLALANMDRDFIERGRPVPELARAA